jgi:hypothetical protein
LYHSASRGAEQLDRLAKTQKIFAEMQGLMEAGLPYATYFQQVQKLYAAADCPDEWQKHHQGGPTGYACREKIVTPNSTGHIKLNQAYAWNTLYHRRKSRGYYSSYLFQP